MGHFSFIFGFAFAIIIATNSASANYDPPSNGYDTSGYSSHQTAGSGNYAGDYSGGSGGDAKQQYMQRNGEEHYQRPYSYPQNKGETFVHRSQPFLLKIPATEVRVNHPPIMVEPPPIVVHRPPSEIKRNVYVKQNPRKVNVAPSYVNIVKPPAEQYYVNEETHSGYDVPPPAPPAYGQQQAEYNIPPAPSVGGFSSTAYGQHQYPMSQAQDVGYGSSQMHNVPNQAGYIQLLEYY